LGSNIAIEGKGIMTKGGEALVEAIARVYVQSADFGFRELLEQLPAAIYTTGPDGTLTFANEAAMRLAGRSVEIGKDKWCVGWRLYWPDGTPLPLEECPMAICLAEHRPVRDIEIVAERPDGVRLPVMPYPTPLYAADGSFVGAVNVLIDISKLKQAELSAARRADEQAALYKFTDRLYRAPRLEDAVDAALDAIVGGLGCKRASILLFDPQGVARFVGWRGLSDGYRAAVEGHCPWKPGEADPQPLFVPEIELADEPESLKATVRAEGISGLAFIPLVANGGTVGKFMTYYETSHIFSEDERALAITIARQLGFSIERRQADTQRDLLVAELSHRVKNTLATVLSIARQSFQNESTPARKTFEGRILALAHTHGQLAEANWIGAMLKNMLASELAPYRNPDLSNVVLAGPTVMLDPRAAVLLGMTFHELATNAAKYGALSSKAGKVQVDWRREPGTNIVAICWSESGGPTVTEPTRRGFGRILLERALKADLRGDVHLRFLPEGLQCELRIPID
jgi:PAS domain S-box-containing protein